MVEPATDVEGVGAVVLPVPPLATVYQRKLMPTAVKGTAGWFWQYVTGEVTPGAGNMSSTITLISALGPSQLLIV